MTLTQILTQTIGEAPHYAPTLRMNGQTFPRCRVLCEWNALLPKRAIAPTLVDDFQCDIAIVGSGYTGFAAARQWAKRAADDTIAVLESSEIGAANLGRNFSLLLEISQVNNRWILETPRAGVCAL